jgi:threonine/homoserine/homoserine lactone efflux protein
VWVGVQAIVHRKRNAAQAMTVEGSAVVAHRSLFVDGFVVGVANPKTIVFFAAVLPQFVSTDGAPAGVQMIVLGLIFAVIALASDSVWGLAAGTARQWLARSPRRLEAIGAAGGVAIVGLGVQVALTRRAD